MTVLARRVSHMAITVRATVVRQAGGDPQLQEAAERGLAKGDPGIQIRLSPQIYNAAAGNYAGWRDTNWMVTVETPEEGEAVKGALAAFFDALALGESEKLTKVLRELQGGQA